MLTLRGIGIAVLVLLMAAVAADAQQPGRHARVGYLVGGAPAFDPRVTRAGTLRMSPECRSDLATTLTPRVDQK